MQMINSQTILSGMALAIMGILALALLFEAVPESNVELVTFALGAISGALTAGSGKGSTPKAPTAPDATNGNGTNGGGH